MPFYRKIGIFGGAGPWASSHAAMQIVQKAQWDYLAVEDGDYPEFTLRSVPLHGFGAKGIENAEEILGQLVRHFNYFAQEGAEIIVIACNSLHRFHPELQSRYQGMKIMNLPRDGAEKAAALGYGRVGVLCSESALEDNLHKTALEEQGIAAILPDKDQQDRINRLIWSVMGGNTGAEEAQIFRGLSREFERAGAQLLLSGCTELSYLSWKYQSNVPVLDCLYVSLEKAMEIAAQPS